MRLKRAVCASNSSQGAAVARACTVKRGATIADSASEFLFQEIEKFIIRQPPMGEKDDFDSENSWISDGLPSSSRRRRRGGGRWEVGEWREK